MALLLGHVHFLAPGAVDLDSRGAYLLAHADGQSVLPLAQHARAHSERALEKLLTHDG